MTPAGNLPAVGYVRVSTREQGDNGHGLAAQEAAIREACERRGWRLAAMHQDVVSTRQTFRPGLADAIARARELGGALVASKVTRPARSTRELLALHEQAQAEGWRLITLDLEHVDIATPQGKAFLGMMAVFAEFERDLISERTREGMAAAAAAGIHCGRPSALMQDKRPEERERALRALPRLLELHALGLSLEKTAAALNREGLASPHGGRWHKKSVARWAKRYGSPDAVA